MKFSHMTKNLSTCAVLLASTAAFSQPASNESIRTEPAMSEGAILYEYRCKSCHEPATPGAPGRDRMRRMNVEEIVDALVLGDMEIMAVGMTQDEMYKVAGYLTSDSL